MRTSVRYLLTVMILVALVGPALTLAGTPAFAQGREEVRFLIQETDPPSVEAYLSMEREFETEYPQYDVVIEFTNPDQIIPKITTVVAAGGVLDVFQPSPSTSARMAQDGLLLAVDDVVDNLGGVDEFFPGTLLQVDDSTYCMGYASGSPVLWYRTDLFEEAGLEPPDTWDEWLAAAEALTNDDTYGIAIAGGENQFTTIILMFMMWSAGTDVFNADLSVNLADNEQAVKALQFYVDLLQYAPPGSPSYSFFDVIDGFTSGRVAMGVYWGRVLGRMYTDAQPELRDKFDAVPLPMDQMRATFADISNQCIYAETEHPEAAKAWLEFTLRPEQAVKLQLTVPGHLAPVSAAQRDLLMASDNQPLAEHPHAAEVLFGVNDYAFNWTLDAGGINGEDLTITRTGIINPYAEILVTSQVLPRALQEVWLNDGDPAEALQKAQEDLEAAIAESG
jgi:multiple sugar transport system substrate-binding protein